MNLRIHAVACTIPRLIAVLAFAIALVALPTFRPEEASARRMTERQAGRACSGAGGSLFYDFGTGNQYTMTCSLPSGNSFSCAMNDGPFADVGNCG